MGIFSRLFGIDDDTQQVLHEVYLTNVYATELDYAERCAEAAQEQEYEGDQQLLRSESRGGYTEAYHAKRELAEYGYVVEDVQEESKPWWHLW